MTIFAFDHVAHNPSFGIGIIEVPAAYSAPFEPGVKVKGYDALDQAWWAGHTLASASDGYEDILPPETYSQEEMAAFIEGVRLGFFDKEWQEEEARESTVPPLTDEDVDAMFHDFEARGGWGSHQD